ncbi:MAG: hypothetical protein EOO43_14560, partial [Flavobacterium sp.]
MMELKIRAFYQKLIISSILVIISAFIVATSLRKIFLKNEIWIEAEDTKQILQPLRTSNFDGASKGAGITAQGNHFVTEGFAKYAFNIEKEGEYVIWGRCYWPTVCNNSFQISVDRAPLQVLGEDPTTKIWHWIRGPKYRLGRGKHELVLWNREEGSRIDKFLITSDPGYVPEGMGTSNSLSEDFQENSGLEKFAFLNRNRWRVSYDKKSQNNYLILLSNGNKQEHVTFKLQNPEFYLFRFTYQFIHSETELMIYLNYKNEADYFGLCLNQKVARLTRKSQDQEKVILEVPIHNFNSKYSIHDISLKKKDDKFEIKRDGVTIFNTSFKAIYGDSIGFGSPRGGIAFDNISITSDLDINYSENFHGPGFQINNIKPELSKEYFQQLKKGRRAWWGLKGKWQVEYDDG